MPIILLNGTSSSGKTTLARTFQEMSDDVYYYISFDKYYHSLPAKLLKSILIQRDKDNLKSLFNWRGFWEGFFLTAVVMHKAGNNVIIDAVCYDQILKICIDIFKDFDVNYLCVKCSLEELKRREVTRGDRRIGMAESQYERVYGNQLYDFQIDTEHKNPKEAALDIISWLNSGQKPSALAIMGKKCYKQNLEQPSVWDNSHSAFL